MSLAARRMRRGTAQSIAVPVYCCPGSQCGERHGELLLFLVGVGHAARSGEHSLQVLGVVDGYRDHSELPRRGAIAEADCWFGEGHGGIRATVDGEEGTLGVTGESVASLR